MEISAEMDRVYMLHQLNVAIEDKVLAVEAMMEFLEITEENLKAASGDSVFNEAKSILNLLKDGDTFPKRLYELYETQVPKALKVFEKTALSLIRLVSDKKVRVEIGRLWKSDRPAIGKIQINNLPNSLRPVTTNDRYIIRSVIELHEKIELYDNYDTEPFGMEKYFRASVSQERYNKISVGTGALNEATEQGMKKRDEYVAYRVYNPLWRHRMERYEPDYVTFPLKWLNDTALIDYLFERHKEGSDVRTIFVSMYKNEEKVSRLLNAIESCPVTESSGPLFREIIDAYSKEKYLISATGLLPMIEGLIWNFAWWWNESHGGLFNRAITLDEYKDSTTFQLLKPDGSLVSGRPNIGKLLHETSFGEQVYFEVVEFLVNELFAERNPVLHGRVPYYGTRKKAASLLFVVETLERQITGAIKNNIQQRLMPDLLSGKFGKFVPPKKTPKRSIRS